MKLSRWNCLALIVIPLACHEEKVTTPLRDPTGLYLLALVGGQLPPVTIRATPGDTTTVVFSVMTLTPPGTASVSDRIRLVHTGTPPTIFDQNYSYSYRIIGDSIAFEHSPPCGPAQLCITPPGASIVGEQLLLTFGDRPPFLYAHPVLN